ncbi:MAG: polyketide synthase dehydratase domain-containing protein [Chroococcus sp. CMT-3BRIN-NPC107]|jgi:acyl transferase domain-containing protein/phosphopantetheinyl transferase|nr:polyketide synthase dehydratase domain-containing protein [Chroococcus sp. CMT-3BRIN-NPC107]
MNSSTDIAIIGMSALFPGARNLQAYWQNILNKVDAVSQAPDKWANSYLDANSRQNDRIYTSKGGFLGDLAQFDPMEFGIMPNSVDGADPDHFLALKVSRDALKDSGYLDRPFNRHKAGIILGRGTYVNRGFGNWMQHGMVVDQTLKLLQQLNRDLDADTLTQIRQELKASLPPFTAEMSPGLVPNIVTGRIANRLDLMGANYLVDGACASSLIAVELAIKELQTDRCDLMLAGGVQASTPPQVHMIFCQLNALSRTSIRPFDIAADGTLLSEGLGVLALKRLADAERDGDRIYAVIKGIGTSSDGKGLGLLAPRKEGQLIALERAYNQSGIDPQTVNLIEAHGTGMPLGDKTEIESITEHFGLRQGILPHRALGSVKSLIGHCIPAAGAASLIKTALALYHKVLPPTICEFPNPELGIEKSSFYINTVARPWINGSKIPRRAGVNAFGFGGINAHAVLEEYNSPQINLLHQQWASELLVFSANSKKLLLALIDKIQHLLATNSVALAEIAYTLSLASIGTHRLAIVAKDIPDLQTKLKLAVEKLLDVNRTQIQTRSGIYYAECLDTANKGKVAFLFPGEGSQYPNMLADLCLYFPKVRAWFDFLDEIFVDTKEHPPSRFIFAPPLGLTVAEEKLAVQQLFAVDTATATVFTASMAMYELLKDFNIPCDLMLGHSTGENTALVASGTVRFAGDKPMADIQNLLGIYRELEANNLIPTGQLLTVGAVNYNVLQQLVEGSNSLYIAMDNCPNQVVLFGNSEDIEQAAQKIRETGGICSLLPFDRAYHTPLFKQVAKALDPYYNALDIGASHTCLYSCATVDVFPTESTAIRSLAAQQWSCTVRFRDTIEKLYEQGVRTFIEVGPSSSLTAFVDDILAKRDHLALASNTQRRDGLEQLQHLLARLFTNDVATDTKALYQSREINAISLEAATYANNQPKIAPILDMTMPVMELSPKTIAAIQSKLNSSRLSTNKTISPLPPLEITTTIPSTLNSAPPVTINAENANFSPQLDSGFAALSTHFDLMQEFLATQNRIATSLFAPAIADNYYQTINVQQYFPFIGQVIEQNEQYLYCQRIFEINSDIFLYDHTLGGKTSQLHPELIPLPVIPFAVSMEILAEAAVYLDGNNKCVPGIYNIRSYSWLALEAEELILDIVAQKSSTDIELVDVQLFQVNGETGDRLLVFSGVVKLSNQFLSTPTQKSFTFDNPKSYSWTDEELYSTGMFHGPRFQGVKHIRQVSSNGIEADLEVLGIDNFFGYISQPVFQIDPPLLDAAAQLVAYWVAELVGMNFHTFPFQITTFEQYKLLAPGSSVIAKGNISFTNERQIESDFDFIDATGNIIARIEGLQEVFITLTPKYHECFASPYSAYLSDTHLQGEANILCQRLAELPAKFLDELSGIIKLTIAYLVLNKQEREFWYSLPEKGGRRTEWLLGRIVAKDAIRQWAKQYFALELAPIDIQILPTVSGKPWVDCPELAAITTLPDISISHSQNCYVAAVSLLGMQIGIDVQKLNGVQTDDWVSGAFNSLELDLLAQPSSKNSALLIGAWCAKEAAAKAAGVGLQGDPKQWQVISYNVQSQQMTILYANESFTSNIYFGQEEVIATCQR